jgi:hypothetical protein
MSAHHSFGLELQPHLCHDPPQAIAVNTLYEHVDIQSQGQLERFDRRLRQIAGPLAYPDITDKICILSIDVHPWEFRPANGDATWNCVIAILMQSRRLHSVRLISPCAMRCHLLCLSCPGREYITSLDLVLPDIRQGFSSMVPQFTRLYKLHVVCRPTKHWTFKPKTGIQNPAVRDFSWTWPQRMTSKNMLPWLALCRFASNIVCKLSIPISGNDRALDLIPFLEAHLFTELALDIPQQSITILEDWIKTVGKLAFMKELPPLSFFAGRPVPSFLSLNAAGSESASDEFWSILNRWEESLEQETKIQHILSVCITGDHHGLVSDFLWTWGTDNLARGEHKHSSKVNRLRDQASRLHSKGIIIVDRDWIGVLGRSVPCT